MSLLVLAIATVAACLLSAPAVVNGDGLGYLKASLSGDLYPGHLAYVPLLRLLRRLFHAGPQPIDGLWLARGLSILSAGVAVLALGAAARRLLDGERPPTDDPRAPRGATLAALGLCASYGNIMSGGDVETYAPALACLCVSLYGLSWRRTGGGGGAVVLAALALAASALFHVENVLFGLVALAALPRPAGRYLWREALLFTALSAGTVLAAYALAGAGPGWLLQASHGFRYPLHLYTPFIALYGACKALLFSPYPYEASWVLVIGHFIPGVVALGALLWVVVARDPDRPTRAPLGALATWAWALPYGAVGVAFFASDAERWIFLLPLFWLTVAASRTHARLAQAVALGLLALNLAVWVPRARDATPLERARRAAAHLQEGDLVVSPGHGWDEYIGEYESPTVGHVPLVFHAGALGTPERVRTALAETIRDARKRHHNVYLVRFDADGDPMGWKELRPFGITPANVRTLLPPGREVPLGDAVSRFDDPIP